MNDTRDRSLEERFQPEAGPPGHRGQSLVTQVLRQAGKAGGRRRPGAHRPGAGLGRGHVAARFVAGSSPRSRRVTIKTRLVNLRQAGRRSVSTHLRYIEREGVGREGEPGQAYDPMTDRADLEAFEARGREDRHQFRLIVSPEDAGSLEELRTFTRHLMERVAGDLGTRLDWVAVDHWNTDNPHTHVVLRGKDETGRDLIIARDYIAQGMRHRACELATEWLGPRTEREIRQGLQREAGQDRWTGLDRELLRQRQADGIRLQRLAQHPRRQPLIGRLQNLQRLGLARELRPGHWHIDDRAERTLRAMGERGDIVRTMQRAMSGMQRELSILEPGSDQVVVGRLAAKGLAGEAHDRVYLVIDGVDGKAHHLRLPAGADPADYPTDAVIEARASQAPSAVDRRVVSLAVEGLYHREHHRTLLAREDGLSGESQGLLNAHERRLEALRRAGIVERTGEGPWRVPADLVERGQQYDARRTGGLSVAVRSPLSIERQIGANGATWLDTQLIAGGQAISDRGFGAEVRAALHRRTDWLVEQRLAERRGARTLFARNLLATLRERELAATARDIEARTGLQHRPLVDGKPASGIYRRRIELASGRYALLDDGLGFSLVPWRPVIEPRLGQRLTARVQGAHVTWQIGRSRGPAIS
ncbi:relaxase/mobilization nuclease and DUF3363 domain-containing protein [Pseudomonas nitrititolerans]|nr:relaxase/mobilization nuclease and DUF3363 domain-containing protein [Stutzerimonas nitrititolerans]MBT1118998.1 relaxase/mobilization nuclease and DUF3363 domain-containing protein [Stutzerimonas nitrititolerans]